MNDPKGAIQQDIETARAEYRTIRDRFMGSPDLRFTRAEFDAAVLGKLSEMGIQNPAPSDWTMAALRVKFLCRRCAGTGQFITYVENGQPKGPGGICFRCDGHGFQGYEDVVRNYWHDMHYVPDCR